MKKNEEITVARKSNENQDDGIEKDATEKVGLYRRKNLEIIHRILLILANQLSC